MKFKCIIWDKTKIHLVARSVVGGDVTSTGFLNAFDENQFR
ncbi:MAG: hypothetical protein ABIH00_00235 [Armatimonadota bacterium]